MQLKKQIVVFVNFCTKEIKSLSDKIDGQYAVLENETKT